MRACMMFFVLFPLSNCLFFFNLFLVFILAFLVDILIITVNMINTIVSVLYFQTQTIP